MAAKLIEWSVRSPSDRVLDPSFGGLVFLEAANARLVALGAAPADAMRQLYGCDLDEDAHAAALAHEQLGLSDEALLHRDFFGVTPGRDLPLASAVAGNPPYVRYQGFNSSGRAGHEVAAAAGVRLTRLASSWAPFVVHSTAFVAPGGRLALVLPAEMLHAQYAADVLAFVQRSFAHTALAVFERRVFPGALEEVVLLFAEGRGEGECAGARVFEYQDLDGLRIPELRERLAVPGHQAPRCGTKRAKLLAQLLPTETQALYESLEQSASVESLGALASVDIGAVTGANDFFLLRAGEHPKLAEELLRPTVSKAIHVRGARLDGADFERLLLAGARCRLFVARDDTPPALLEGARAFLAQGRRRGVDKRYKCRVREPWWSVPMPKHGVPSLLLTYCASEYPRLVWNEFGALSTNTLHGVSLLTEAVPPPALAAGFYNSLTLLSAELVGRSYGGGVLKLEPTEAESLLVPPIPPHACALLDRVDELIRGGDLNGALDLTDPLLLGDGLGLTVGQQQALRAGAERLRSRRRARGKAPASG